MQKDLLEILAEGSPAESRKRLTALARTEGLPALDTLRQALTMPRLVEAALHALGEIPAQEAWELLDQAAREGTTPGRRKAARRAQHRLRSRGFRPAAPAREPPQQRIELAQASFLDHEGDQFLRVLQTAPLGMCRYAVFIVSPQGVEDCFFALAGRGDIEQIIAEENSRFGEDLVDVDVAYLARRVRQAVARSREHGEPLPEDYLEAARLLRDAPEDGWPHELEIALDQDASLTPVRPNETRALFDHPRMQRWTFSPNQLISYVEEWLRVLEHQSMVTEEGLPNLGAVQSRRRIFNRMIDELIDEDTRLRLVEQMREHARLLYALGETALAVTALHYAGGLEQDGSPDNPFLRTLVEETLEYAVAMVTEFTEEEAEERSAWRQPGGQAGPLWLPRPAGPAEEEEEEEPPPRLWLPGQ